MNTVIAADRKFSLSFKYAVFLIIYTTIYYYIYNSVSSLIAHGLTCLGFLASILVILRKGILVKSSSTLAIIFLMLLSMLVTNFINSAVWGSTVTCITMLSSLYIFTAYPLKKSETKYLTALLCLFVVAILLNCNIGNEFIEGKFNPNSGGFVLAILFCVLFTWFLKTKRILPLLASILCIYLQTVYISRTALLCCILFTLINILCFKCKFVKGKTLQITVFLLGLFGIVIAYVYSNILFEVIGYGKLQIFGKDLFTGREDIWRGAFYDIIQNPIFGVGGDLNKEFAIQSGNPLVSNAHNQSVGLAAAFGIPVFIAYYWLLSKTVSTTNKKNSVIVAIFIITFIIMSYFDVYFFAMINVGPILIAYCIINSCCQQRS